MGTFFWNYRSEEEWNNLWHYKKCVSWKTWRRWSEISTVGICRDEMVAGIFIFRWGYRRRRRLAQWQVRPLGGSGFWWKLMDWVVPDLRFIRSWRGMECWLGFRCHVESDVARIILKRLFAHVVGVTRSYSLWTFPVGATCWIGRSWAVSIGCFLYEITKLPVHYCGLSGLMALAYRRYRKPSTRRSWQMCKFWKWGKKVKLVEGEIFQCVYARTFFRCVRLTLHDTYCTARGSVQFSLLATIFIIIYVIYILNDIIIYI